MFAVNAVAQWMAGFGWGGGEWTKKQLFTRSQLAVVYASLDESAAAEEGSAIGNNK